MKNIKYLFYSLLSASVVFTSCDSEDDLIKERIEDTTAEEVVYVPGTADFSNYIALGNSLTAGYMDGALYTEGQDASFVNIIGQQMVAAGLTGEFNQPDINSVNGFNSTFSDFSDPANPVIAGKTILDISIPGPVPTFPGDLISAYSGNKGALNNFGVPGAKVADLLMPGYGFPDLGNPYFTRFASNPSTTSILADALATNPTFYTLWIGSNDVLGYALGGGAGSDPLDVYSAAQFQADYSSIIGQLAAKGAKGVVINMPAMLLIPYLRAVPYNPVPLTADQATALNAGFAGFNAALDGLVAPPPFGLGVLDAADAEARKVSYAEGDENPLLIVDEDLTDLSGYFDILQSYAIITAEQRAALQPFVQARPATAADLVPLATAPVIGEDLNPLAPGTVLRGISYPLDDKYILTPNEQVAAVTARATYSAIIEGIAAATPGVEMYDIQPLFADIAGLSSAQATQLALTPSAIAAADGELGITYEGVKIAPDFSPSGLFSTDGVHPNPRGHAILANNLIDFINTKFGSNIPKVNSTVYRTVLFQ